MWAHNDSNFSPQKNYSSNYSGIHIPCIRGQLASLSLPYSNPGKTAWKEIFHENSSSSSILVTKVHGNVQDKRVFIDRRSLWKSALKMSKNKGKKVKWIPVSDFQEYFPPPQMLYQYTGHIKHSCYPDEPCRCLVETDLIGSRCYPSPLDPSPRKQKH